MTILYLKPDALVVPEFDYSTIYDHMGNNESSAVLMEAPSSYVQWGWRGYFGMGYRLYGDNLNTTFLGGYDVTDPDQTKRDRLIAAKAAIQTTWADNIIPWFCANAEATNRCTNAALRITGTQCYTLDDTGVWSRQGTAQSFAAACTGYTISSGATSGGYPCDNLYLETSNIPAFPFCPNNAHWGSIDTDPPTTSKFRFLHTKAMERITLADPSKLRGVLVTFESQLVSTNGQAFNSTPKFLIQAGCDAGYGTYIVGGIGLLEGAPYSPGLGGSRWSYANSDGTRRRHYFATFMAANSSEDLTSAYNVGGGVSKQTAAEFLANMPKRVYQPTL